MFEGAWRGVDSFGVGGGIRQLSVQVSHSRGSLVEQNGEKREIGARGRGHAVAFITLRAVSSHWPRMYLKDTGRNIKYDLWNDLGGISGRGECLAFWVVLISLP